ncbi:hypothetical protein ABZX92_01915 [Lentzea sp. NPDC006480]|uniref:hypothetical protein n=1 Tax=Lentzea sp. NPDC006480 TaxID=3157176 RepID=UPI0033AFB48A
MPEGLHDFESYDPGANLPRGRRHPFDAHMATAPLWVKVVSRAGVVVTLAGLVVIVLGSLGLGPHFSMVASGIYLGGFGVLVSLVSMAFHPRR